MQNDSVTYIFNEVRVQEALKGLSESFIHNVFDGNIKPCVELLDPDMVWLSPFADEGIQGIKELRQFCHHIKTQEYRIVLIHQKFEICSIKQESCLVVAQAFLYIGTGKGDSVFGRPFRVVFHWNFQGANTARITCINVTILSNLDHCDTVTHDEKDDVNSFDRWSRHIEFKDDRGITHFIDEDDIVYIEAQGRKTIIHCNNGNFPAQQSIKILESLLGEQFVRLHRTYLVNGWKVKSLSSKGALMADGSLLPVPIRRLMALRKEINKVRKPRQLSLSDLEHTITAAISQSDDDAHSKRSGSH